MTGVQLEKNKHLLSKRKITGGLIFALVLILSATLMLLYPFASKDKKDYFQEKNPILFNGSQHGNAVINDNTVYVPYSFLKKYIDKDLVYDEKSQSIIITTSNKVIQMPPQSLTYYVNKQAVKLKISPLKTVSGELYVSLEPLESLYPIQYKILKETGAIWIQENGYKYNNGQIINKDINNELLRLRTTASLRSAYTSEMHKNEKVIIETEKGDYYLVRKQNGISGYIKKKYVEKGKLMTIRIARNSEEMKTPVFKGPVQLTWEAVYTKNPDIANIPSMTGINVVSPTWFSLDGKDGSIKNLASIEYSNWAKSKGFQVWGLFSNDFNPALTHEALKDYETRQKIIVQLLNFSKMYHLQGINFDIENVNKEDGPFVTQLIREAAPYLHKAGLVVSADITFAAGESSWSSFYERSKLAKAADYLIIMAYDEHWGSSSGSGSVASLPWVEENLQSLLKEVPHDRLILGVPLYTRLWKEQLKEDGSTEVTAKALTMDDAKAWIAEKKLQPTYDSESGQNYVEYHDSAENATYKMWIEDNLSLKKRSDLVIKYNLAGIASWSRYFGDQTAWTSMDLNKAVAVSKK